MFAINIILINKTYTVMHNEKAGGCVVEEFELEEIVCNLKLGDANNDNHSALVLQEQLAKNLVDAYLQPSLDRVYDKWKIDRYRKQGKYQLDQLSPPTVWREKTVYELFAWVRPAHRFLVWLGIDFTPFLALGKYIPFIGLELFAFMAAFEFFVLGRHVINHIFSPVSDLQNRLTWEKVKNLLLQDERPARLARIAIWLSTSIVLSVLTGGFSMYVQLGALVLDTAIHFWVRNHRINQSIAALDIIQEKKDAEYQTIKPFLEEEITFQRNRHRLYVAIASVMIGSTVALLPFATIPLLVGATLMVGGAAGILKQLVNLGRDGLFKMFDRAMKRDYGVDAPRKDEVANEPDLEDGRKVVLSKAKAETLAIIDDYKKQCSLLNFYGYNRANELAKRIDYAKNLKYLRHEVAFFIKTGKTESDRAKYNVLRSASRSSGIGSGDLRGSLYDKLVPAYRFYQRPAWESPWLRTSFMYPFLKKDLAEAEQQVVFPAEDRIRHPLSPR